MQEQPPYKITPEQGWAQMAHVLDREMPVLRRSRRIIIFWWSAAAVTTAVMLSLFVLISGDKTASPAVTQQTTTSAGSKQMPSQPIVDLSSPSLIDQKPEMNESSSAQNGSSSVQEHKDEKSDKLVPVRKENSQGDTPRRKSVVDSNNTFAENSGDELLPEKTTDQLSSEIAAETLEILPGAYDEKPAGLADELNIRTTDMRATDIVDFLPLASIDKVEPTEEILDLNASITPYVHKQPLFAPHVGVSMLEGYFGGLGIHAGAGLAINVLPRLSVTTDFGFNVYEPDVMFLGSENKLRESADTDNILREDINSGGIGTYIPADLVNNSAGNVISPFIQTIMQWQVSAGLKYKLSQKFSAEAGAAYLFGTTSTSLYPIAEESYGSTTGFQNVSNSFDSYKVLKSNSTLVYAGIGYKPGNKWEFHIHWNHAIDPYLVNNPVPAVSFAERTDYIRGLSLGLKYLL